MIIEFSDSDFLQSKVVEPAWYRVLIEKVEDKLSKDGKSTNTWLSGKILFNADTGDKTNAGVPSPFPWLFNSKAAWSAVGFAQAMGMEAAPGKRFDFNACQGREIDMFIENDFYEGILKNVTKHKYRAPREVTA
jgi:hypothetical protein